MIKKNMSFDYISLKNYIDSEVRNAADSVTNLRTLINNAVQEELLELGFRSTQRHTKTLQAVYDDVFRYPTPDDMIDEGIIDILKIKHFDEGSKVNFRKKKLRNFLSNRHGNTIAFDYDKGVKWMLGSFNTANSSVVINSMNGLTDNGSWSAADDGTSIAQNITNYISGDTAIQVTGNGTAVSVVNSTMSEVDVSEADKLFVWVYFPSVSNLTNIVLLYGSDASNYYTATATSPFNIDSFREGWNLVGFDLGTETGDPDNENIDYIKLTANYSAASTDIIIFDSLFAGIGEYFELIYESFYAWRDTSGTWKENSSSNSDLLNAGVNEFAVLKKKCAYNVACNIPMADSDINRLYNKYEAEKERYKLKYPRQRKREKYYY